MAKGYKCLTPMERHQLYQHVEQHAETLSKSTAGNTAMAEGIGKILSLRIPPTALKQALSDLGVTIPANVGGGVARKAASNADVARLRADVELALARCGELKTAVSRLRPDVELACRRCGELKTANEQLRQRVLSLEDSVFAFVNGVPKLFDGSVELREVRDQESFERGLSDDAERARLKKNAEGRNGFHARG